MAELSFDDLIPASKSSGAGKDLSFDDLIPAQKSSVPAAIRDIPEEVGAAVGSAIQSASGNSVRDLQGYDPRTRGQLGPIEGLLRTGRQIAAIPEVVIAPALGVARSVGGHALGAVEDFLREKSGMPADPQGSYARGKGDVDLALAAARPAGAPVSRPGPLGSGPSYRWQGPAAPPSPVPTEGQEVALAAQRLSETGAPVQIPRAVTTDSMAVQRAAATARNIPGAGDPIVKATDRALGQLGAKVDEVTTGYGGGTVEGAGDAAAGSIKNWITGESKKTANKLYDRVDNLVDPDSRTQLFNARGVAAEIEAERMAARLPNGKAVDSILEAVNDGNGLTYQGIKTLRSAIGEQMNSSILPEGMSASDLKRIYSALSDDLRSSVLVGGGQRAVAEFDRANRYYKLASDRRESLAKIVGRDGDAPPEKVFDRLLSMAGSSSRADISKLAQARKTIGAEDWNEFVSGVTSRLGRDAEGNFSPALFVRDYGKISDAGKTMLFRSGGKGDLAQHLDDIAKVSSRYKELQKFSNPSGTGQAVFGGGIGAGLLADPLTTASMVLGGRTVAYALSRPASAASLAKFAKAQQALQTSPSPARVAAFSMASRNLIATLGERAQGISVEQFLRGVRDAVPVRANDEEDEADRPRN